MNEFSFKWLVILSVSVIGMGLVTLIESVPPVVRIPVAAWFLLVCPGMAFARMIGLREDLALWILAIALSLALDAIVAGAMVFTDSWSVKFGVITLIAITLFGTGLQLIPWGARWERRT